MTLDPDQQLVVDSDHPNILCVANAGSGKTRALAARILRVAATIDPLSIVAITFTNQAAREMQKRLGNVRLGYIGTLHGFMLRILRTYGHLIGLKQPSVMDEQQSDDLVDDIISSLRLKVTAAQLRDSLPMAWAILRKRAPSTNPAPSLIGAMEYYNWMRTENLLDYDSLLAFGLWAVEEAIKQEKWKERYVALFVDEVQDANPIDLLIYHELPMETRFMVGDSDQSIYGFRGADVGGILGMSRQSGVKVFALLTNYRSDIDVCKAADGLIKHNTTCIAKSLMPHSEELGQVLRCGHETPADEAHTIGQRIKASVGDTVNDFAVLLRTNALARYFTEQLEKQGVKVRKREWQQLPPDWQKCRMFLSLLVNPENDTLAHWWLKESRGQFEANKIKLKALGNYTTINRYLLKIPKDIPVSEVPSLLARANIGAESVALVIKGMRELDPDDDLAALSLRLGQDREPVDDDGVTVTTAHAAKGREWSTVFIPCLVDGVWPPGRVTADIQEERRLLYVAMTRAEHELILSKCDMAFDWNMKLRPAEPSPFWGEL